MTQTHWDWVDRLLYALWGYRKIVRTSTGATPFSLVYKSKAIVPVKMEIKSLRIAIKSKLPEA